MRRVLLWFMAFGALGFSLAHALWLLPVARLTEAPLRRPTARIDFAALYGGLQLGLRAFLLHCARRPARLIVGLWAATAALAGVGTIRLLSLLVAPGPPTDVMYAGLAIELSGAGLSIWATRRAAAEARGRRRAGA